MTARMLGVWHAQYNYLEVVQHIHVRSMNMYGNNPKLTHNNSEGITFYWGLNMRPGLVSNEMSPD
jgi:hypothetical protein